MLLSSIVNLFCWSMSPWSRLTHPHIDQSSDMLYIAGFAPDSTQMIFHIGFRMSVCLDFYVTSRSLQLHNEDTYMLKMPYVFCFPFVIFYFFVTLGWYEKQYICSAMSCMITNLQQTLTYSWISASTLPQRVAQAVKVMRALPNNRLAQPETQSVAHSSL